jgi:hypothetical protein
VREAIEHLLRTRTGVTKSWLVDKPVAIIDTDLADVSEWDGELIFKSSAELTPEQKVAISEIVRERTREGSTLKIRLYVTHHCREPAARSQQWGISPNCST